MTNESDSGMRASGAHPMDPPSEDEIAERAYQIYLSRARGSADENWRRAEEELRKRRSSPRRRPPAR